MSSVSNQIAVAGYHPRDGKNIEQRSHWMRVGTVVEIVMLSIVLILFNLYPHRIGIILSLNGPFSFVPILSPEFSVHLMLLNTLWGVSLLFAMTKFAIGRWTLSLRWAEFGLNLFSLFVLIQLAFGPPIFGVDPELPVIMTPAVATFQSTVIPILNTVFRPVLGLVCIILFITLPIKFVQLVIRTGQYLTNQV